MGKIKIMLQLRLYTRRNYLISRNLVFANHWKKISFYLCKLQPSIIQAFQPKSFVGYSFFMLSNSFHEKQDADFPIATIIFKNNPYFRIAIYYCKSKSSCKQSYNIHTQHSCTQKQRGDVVRNDQVCTLCVHLMLFVNFQFDNFCAQMYVLFVWFFLIPKLGQRGPPTLPATVLGSY